MTDKRKEGKISGWPVVGTHTEYKIRCKETGEYSAGGEKPSWSKKGKVWRSQAALSGHLALVLTSWRGGKRKRSGYAYGGYAWYELELVEYRVTVQECGRSSLEDRVNEQQDRHSDAVANRTKVQITKLKKELKRLEG